MLKWAVNGTRQSYLSSENCPTNVVVTRRTNSAASARRSMSSIGTPSSSAAADRRKLRRKSSDISSMRQKLRSHDKENRLTSTPLPLSGVHRKLGSLKDLSNITTTDEYNGGSPMRKRKCHATPPVKAKPPLQYASTLPTFDIEYSPCGAVPGPILALRGIGIADTYFEKPRYLTQEFKELNYKEEKDIPRPAHASAKCDAVKPPHEEDSSLSSSRMGDMTLERMIDAILESARKDRKQAKNSKQTASRPPVVMSPTYTPADDPASDLHEFWDAQTEKYQQHTDDVPIGRPQRLPQPDRFNEREVRSPVVGRKNTNDEDISCLLRRQRAVRRKRKLNVIKTSVRNSAQKLFASTTTNPKSFDQLAELETLKRKHRHNISPDSGRNSSSDLEDSTVEGTAVNSTTNCLKRRLSFSINALGDI